MIVAAKTAPAKKTVAKKTTTKRAVRRPAAKDTVSTAVHAYIPDPSIAQRYIGRKVHGVWDIDIANIAMAEKKNILLMGDTGAGKTLFGEAYASIKRLMYYSLPCDVSIDPSALFGRMQPTDTPGKFEWQDGPVTQVVRHGGVLNISEINFMTPKIAASLYPLLDGRRYVPLLGHKGEVVRAHKDLLIIADMNPQYRGTMELNAAFKNRFDFKIRWGYESDVEERLVEFPTLRTIAEKLREMVGTEVHTPVSTNMLMEFEQFALHPALSLDFAIENFLAAFESREQDSISKVFDLNKSKLEQDTKFFRNRKNKATNDDEDDDDLEEVEWEQEEEN